MSEYNDLTKISGSHNWALWLERNHRSHLCKSVPRITFHQQISLLDSYCNITTAQKLQTFLFFICNGLMKKYLSRYGISEDLQKTNPFILAFQTTVQINLLRINYV